MGNWKWHLHLFQSRYDILSNKCFLKNCPCAEKRFGHVLGCGAGGGSVNWCGTEGKIGGIDGRGLCIVNTSLSQLPKMTYYTYLDSVIGTCLYYLSEKLVLVYGKLLRFQILDHIA